MTDFDPKAEARRALGEGRPMKATLAQALLMHAQSAHAAEDVVAARRYIEAALVEDERNPVVHAFASAIFSAYGDRPRVAQHARIALAHAEDRLVPGLVKTLAEVAPELEELEDAARKIAQHGDALQRVAGYSALSLVLHHQKRYEEAWISTQRMNAARLELDGVWNSRELDIIAEIMRRVPWSQAIDQAAGARAEADEDAQRLDHVFIVGMPRSGTTLLHRELLRAQNVYSIGEDGGLMKLFTEAPRRSATNMVAAGRQYDAWILQKIERDFYRGVIAQRPTRSLCKTPHNLLFAGLIPLIWGDRAKVLHCTRDPRAVLVSCFRQDFASSWLNWTCRLSDIRQVQALFQEASEAYRPLFGDAWLEVPLESSVVNHAYPSITQAVLGDDVVLGQVNPALPTKTASSFQVQQAPSRHIFEDGAPYYQFLE